MYNVRTVRINVRTAQARSKATSIGANLHNNNDKIAI